MPWNGAPDALPGSATLYVVRTAGLTTDLATLVQANGSSGQRNFTILHQVKLLLTVGGNFLSWMEKYEILHGHFDPLTFMSVLASSYILSTISFTI